MDNDGKITKASWAIMEWEFKRWTLFSLAFYASMSPYIKLVVLQLSLEVREYTGGNLIDF